MQLEVLKKPWIKSALIAASIGFILSFLLVLIFGGGFPALILKPLLSGLLLAAVWTAVYFLLQKFVPDIINEFKPPESNENFVNENGGGINQAEDFNFDLNEDIINHKTPLDEPGSESGEQQFSEDIRITEGTSDAKPKKVRKKAAANEIMVDGVPMAKDPDLMAKAIQHVLDSDED